MKFPLHKSIKKRQRGATPTTTTTGHFAFHSNAKLSFKEEDDDDEENGLSSEFKKNTDNNIRGPFDGLGGYNNNNNDEKKKKKKKKQQQKEEDVQSSLLENASLRDLMDNHHHHHHQDLHIVSDNEEDYNNNNDNVYDEYDYREKEGGGSLNQNDDDDDFHNVDFSSGLVVDNSNEDDDYDYDSLPPPPPPPPLPESSPTSSSVSSSERTPYSSSSSPVSLRKIPQFYPTSSEPEPESAAAAAGAVVSSSTTFPPPSTNNTKKQNNTTSKITSPRLLAPPRQSNTSRERKETRDRIRRSSQYKSLATSQSSLSTSSSCSSCSSSSSSPSSFQNYNDDNSATTLKHENSSHKQNLHQISNQLHHQTNMHFDELSTSSSQRIASLQNELHTLEEEEEEEVQTEETEEINNNVATTTPTPITTNEMQERLDAIKALGQAALKQKQCIQKQRQKYEESQHELEQLKMELEEVENEKTRCQVEKKRLQNELMEVTVKKTELQIEVVQKDKDLKGLVRDREEDLEKIERLEMELSYWKGGEGEGEEKKVVECKEGEKSVCCSKAKEEELHQIKALQEQIQQLDDDDDNNDDDDDDSTQNNKETTTTTTTTTRELQMKINQLTQELTQAQQELSDATSKSLEHEKRAMQLEEKLKQQDCQTQENVDDMDNDDDDVLGATVSSPSSEKDITTLKQQNNQLKIELQETKTQLSNTTTQSLHLLQKSNQLEAELEQRTASLEQTLSQLQNQLSATQTQNLRLQDEKHQLEMSIARQNQQLNNVDLDLRQKITLIETLDQELDEARKSLAEYNERFVKEMEEDLMSMDDGGSVTSGNRFGAIFGGIGGGVGGIGGGMSGSASVGGESVHSASGDCVIGMSGSASVGGGGGGGGNEPGSNRHRGNRFGWGRGLRGATNNNNRPPLDGGAILTSYESIIVEKDLRIENLEKAVKENEDMITKLKSENVRISTNWKQTEYLNGKRIADLEEENAALSEQVKTLKEELKRLTMVEVVEDKEHVEGKEGVIENEEESGLVKSTAANDNGDEVEKVKADSIEAADSVDEVKTNSTLSINEIKKETSTMATQNDNGDVDDDEVRRNKDRNDGDGGKISAGESTDQSTGRERGFLGLLGPGRRQRQNSGVLNNSRHGSSNSDSPPTINRRDRRKASEESASKIAELEAQVQSLLEKNSSLEKDKEQLASTVDELNSENTQCHELMEQQTMTKREEIERMRKEMDRHVTKILSLEEELEGKTKLVEEDDLCKPVHHKGYEDSGHVNTSEESASNSLAFDHGDEHHNGVLMDAIANATSPKGKKRDLVEVPETNENNSEIVPNANDGMETNHALPSSKLSADCEKNNDKFDDTEKAATFNLSTVVKVKSSVRQKIAELEKRSTDYCENIVSPATSPSRTVRVVKASNDIYDLQSEKDEMNEDIEQVDGSMKNMFLEGLGKKSIVRGGKYDIEKQGNPSVPPAKAFQFSSGTKAEF